MPRAISTNQLERVLCDALVVDDRHPDAFGFRVRLAEAIDPEWAIEFLAVYDRRPHPLKPPIDCDARDLVVHFLPKYQSELPEFLDHLREVVAETNALVRARNAALPDHSAAEAEFLAVLARHATRVADPEPMETPQ